MALFNEAAAAGCKSISPETRARALLHEAHHAAVDLPASGYVLGIDERRTLRDPVAENRQNTGPNSPVRYPYRPIKPALKPILERFDFVKLSGFSLVFSAAMTRPETR